MCEEACDSSQTDGPVNNCAPVNQHYTLTHLLRCHGQNADQPDDPEVPVHACVVLPTPGTAHASNREENILATVGGNKV